PFTDVSPAICPYVLEMYYLGITAGTSPTTYSPDATVTRGQAAVFVSKGVNQAIARSSRRAALGQWWTTSTGSAFPLDGAGLAPFGIASDGSDVWVASAGQVARLRGSDGRPLGVWTGVNGGAAVLSAMGRIFVTGNAMPGVLYMIDPTQSAGPATVVASNLGQHPLGLGFDGTRLWTANPGGSVSIITPSGS